MEGPPDWADEEEALEEEEYETQEQGAPRKGFFKRLRQRLKGTREKFVHRMDRLVLGKKVIDDDCWKNWRKFSSPRTLG